MNSFDFNSAANDRRRRYRELLDFYHGRHWAGTRREEKRLTFNYAAAVVDKLTAYLVGGLSVKAVSHDASAETVLKAQRLLEKTGVGNNLDRLDYETEIDAAVLGDGCYRLGWDAASGTVRVTSPDIASVDVGYAIDGVAVEKVTLSYTVFKAVAIQAWGFNGGTGILPAGSTIPGGIGILPVDSDNVDVVETWTTAEYQVACNGEVVTASPNPYGFIPFIVFPNLPKPKSPWGISDLEPLVEVQRELNRSTSQLSRILELSGNPIAVLENVESSQDIAVAPGAVWHIPEEAKAYLLDLLQGGGAQLHLNYIDLLFRMLHDLSEMPRAAFCGMGRDVSGVALELELQPLLHRIWRKRLIRTGVYRRRAEMMLALYAKYLGENFDGVGIEVTWAPVLPRDIAATVASEQTLVQSGIHSRKRAMAGLGIADPDKEFADWLAERESILKMNRSNNLKAGESAV
ncbi:phage portal protein [Dehalogenimonas etheniformans]|uniref:Phage portal protein n=1 Tax=Dehalogenimonas etheniformans TaxID=1536648 RepID=A0A2P5P6T1_9CHLR|nr:phage portal protein [Dehalogenimonas etheniformans]PPD58016.1 phage portal protein [Dehalogenimonas etheniformans]QNT75366.1 phage portal protein [Dehalogenimonas etheniformans]